MPTKTYLRLPKEKQERIFDAGVEEFAQHRFSEASINRIVKSAGISRGSFYQYFQGKEDLYLLIMEHISKEKMTIFAQQPLPPVQTNVFEMMAWAMPAIFDWAQQHPKYNQIGFLMAHDDNTFVRKILKQIDSGKKAIRTLLENDQKSGKIRKDADIDTVIELIVLFSEALFCEYYFGEGREKAIAKIRSMLDVLERGICDRSE